MSISIPTEKLEALLTSDEIVEQSRCAELVNAVSVELREPAGDVERQCFWNIRGVAGDSDGREE